MNEAKHSPHQGTHRVYFNSKGGELIRCERLSNEELARLAEETDGLVVQQVGVNQLPTSEIGRVKSLVEALQWKHRELLTDPGLFRRLMIRQLGERRMKLNTKTGRIFLGGVTTRVMDTVARRVLLLVVVPRNVNTCDFQL